MKAGDRVKYTGSLTRCHKGKTGTVTTYAHAACVEVKFDDGTSDWGLLESNLTLLDDQTVPLDPTKPLFLNDGTPVHYVSHTDYHIVFDIPTKYQPHDARKTNGSGSHSGICAHRMSKVLTHNHAFTLTNEAPNMTNAIDKTKPLRVKGTDEVVTLHADQGCARSNEFFIDTKGCPTLEKEWKTLTRLYVQQRDGLIPGSLKGDIYLENFEPFETRVVYGVANGHTLKESIADLRKHYASGGWTKGIVEYTQEKRNGDWHTVSVAMAPTEEYKFFDMNMQPLTDAPTDASHIKVTMMAGIVSNTEIVHP